MISQCDRVVLATGGLSVPATGSDGTRLDRGATPGSRDGRHLSGAHAPVGQRRSCTHRSSGVSLDVRLRAKSGSRVHEAFGGFLFTHRGYSGPSVLDVSHLTERGAKRRSIRAQWSTLSAADWESEFDARSASVATILARHIPGAPRRAADDRSRRPDRSPDQQLHALGTRRA